MARVPRWLVGVAVAVAAALALPACTTAGDPAAELGRSDHRPVDLTCGQTETHCLLARLTSVVVVVALATTSCGDRLTKETPQPVATVTPKPTTLSLAELIRSGRLRVAFNQLNITCIQSKNSGLGVTGVCVDIADELATQLHATLDVSLYATGGALMDAGRAGDWDVAFVDVDLNFPQPGINATAAYLEVEQTYLVRGDASYRSVADVDRPGVRIACFTPSAIEGFLKQNLKYATVVDSLSIADGVRLIEQREADAYAGSRDELDDGGWRLAEGRILTDSITRSRWGVVVASGRSDLFAYVTQFLETVKKNGVIQDAIDKNTVSGARVAQ